MNFIIKTNVYFIPLGEPGVSRFIDRTGKVFLKIVHKMVLITYQSAYFYSFVMGRASSKAWQLVVMSVKPCL